MNEQPKPRSAEKGDRIFDQFCLTDEFGGSFIDSARAMRVMRWLRKKPTTEGVLANACGERPFLHEWTLLINRLVEVGYIKSEFSGHGTTKLISLTENGEKVLEHHLGPKEPEQVEPEQTTQQG